MIAEPIAGFRVHFSGRLVFHHLATQQEYLVVNRRPYPTDRSGGQSQHSLQNYRPAAGLSEHLPALERFRERKHVADTLNVVASFDMVEIAEIIDELQAEADRWKWAADGMFRKWRRRETVLADELRNASVAALWSGMAIGGM
jgi:hypothetical protein